MEEDDIDFTTEEDYTEDIDFRTEEDYLAFEPTDDMFNEFFNDSYLLDGLDGLVDDLRNFPSQ